MKEKNTSAGSVNPILTNNKVGERPMLGRIARLIAAVLVAAVLWLLLVKPSGNFQTVPIKLPIPTVAVPAIQKNDRFRQTGSLGLVVGDQLVYEFQQKCSLKVQGSSFAGIVAKGATNQVVAVEIEQRGKFVVNVYSDTTSGWLVGFSFRQPTILMGLRDGTGLEHAAGAELEAEVLALVKRSGRIGKIVTQASISEEALNHWRDVLARWQTVLPGNPDTQNWTMAEEDGIGTYVASYSRGTSSGKSTLTKRKQRYTVIRSGGGALGEPSTDVSGSAVIQLNPYPVQIEGREVMAIRTPEIGGSVDSSAAYSFRLEAASTSQEVTQGGPDKLRVFQSSSDVGWASMSGATSAATIADIKGTTINEQIQELELLLGQGLNGTTAELKTLEKIKALVEHDDATVPTIIERLRNQSGERDENLDAALTGMLGAAGTPKAQKALLELASSAAWPKDVREKALFTFAQVLVPIGEVDQALVELHERKDDLSNNALLILGAMGDRVRNQDPERFGQISDTVLAAASAPNLDLNDELAALEAIGNLGPKQVPEALRKFLESDDPSVRQKAVLSLQRVPVEEAYPWFQNAIQNDVEETVRAAAAKLVGGTLWAEGYAHLANAAQQDPSELVRMAAVSALGEWGAENEDAILVLRSVVVQDPAEQVRDVAAQILQSRVIAEAEDGVR